MPNFTKLVELPPDQERRIAIVTEMVETLHERGQPWLIVSLEDIDAGPTPEIAVLHVFPEGLYPRWFPHWWPERFLPMHPVGFVTWLWMLVRWRWFDVRNPRSVRWLRYDPEGGKSGLG